MSQKPKQHRPTQIVPQTFIKKLSEFEKEQYQNKFEQVLSYITDAIGEPYYAKDGFILYNNSCTHFLNELKKQQPIIDLVVTSPPYNIGKEYETDLDIKEYVDWCEKWMSLLYDCSTDKSSFWLNVGHFEVPKKGLCVPIPYLIWDKSEYFLLQELVWKYGAGVQTKKRLSPRNEKWLYYVKDPKDYVFNLDEIRDPDVKYPNQKKNGKLRCNPLGKNPSDVWDIPKVTTGKSRASKERVDHPAQFPLAIIERLVKVSSNPFQTVFDPFSGSGSTGIATHAFNRIYVGTELSQIYCDVTIDRFERYLEYRSEKLSQTTLL